MVVPQIAADERLKALLQRVSTGTGVVSVSGLWGSSAPMVLAHLANHVSRPFVFLTAHLEHADQALDDTELFIQRACTIFPAWEGLPGEGAGAGEIDAERLHICGQLHHGTFGRDGGARVLIAPIQAVMQPVPTADVLVQNTLSLLPGHVPDDPAVRSPEGLLGWAIDRGYECLDLVESPGDVAHRGDIVDLFPPGEAQPYRISYLDDQVESIRRFDIDSKRSIATVEQMTITSLPPQRNRETTGASAILDYLPDDAILVINNPGEVQEMGQILAKRLGEAGRLFGINDILRQATRFQRLEFFSFPQQDAGAEDQFSFQVGSMVTFEGSPGDSLATLMQAATTADVYVFCDNEGERNRLREMLLEADGEIGERIHLEIGLMHRGFEWRATRTIVISHHEIFHRHRQRRRLRKMHAARPIESWTDLKAGDYVVHVAHGIGKFRGLKQMEKGEEGQFEEFLTIEFADKAVVHVPSSQIDLVQKYIGAGGVRPKLSKLGGKRWAKAKESVAEGVAELAERLLAVQATRESGGGLAYPHDTEWQREFESAFLYEETEDQLLVAREIKDDLLRPRPMDRLICGDVGYGKTELAMRAVFKVVEYGRQVAVLVPTTVLAEQHFQTFCERMAEYPFSVACLSRFRSPKEQRTILEKLKKGQLDVVIGTHRLLSKDVSFANLGLTIIDEEQRFGVEHKERLKNLRETVDVLTLSATPIPRTLHMTMVGLRDISTLQTPPVDRRSIATQVRPFDRELIRNAILRELNRDGQTYFIHNVVRGGARGQSIGVVADTIQSVVPEARVVYGHGQMKADALEEVMHRFLSREADVLVATTIIESGIDIPSANTIFINNADNFGLADLHQLRGRVGRSNHKAYCYLLFDPKKHMNPQAAKRLKAIEEFSELGAGFRIAMRDLEIRGAGNLLGREQSGHIAAVGYELYCQLLDHAVRRLKHQPAARPPAVQVDLDVRAHIPRNYIHAEQARMEAYRRIVGCDDIEELQALERDLQDAFGRIPPQVGTLLDLAEIRVRARGFGIRSISRRPPDVIFVIESVARVEPLFINARGTVRMPDPLTVHFRPPPNYLEPSSLIPVLRRMLQRAEQQVVETAS